MTTGQQGHILDDHHRFAAGKPELACGSTADMLFATRYTPHVEVTGDQSVHHGLIPCGALAPAAAAPPGGSPACR